MLTKEELEEIAKRAEAATPGPWETHDEEANVGEAWVRRAVTFPVKSFSEKSIVGSSIDIATAEFIAHARTDIPALLAHIAGLEAEIEKILELAGKHEAPITPADNMR